MILVLVLYILIINILKILSNLSDLNVFFVFLTGVFFCISFLGILSFGYGILGIACSTILGGAGVVAKY